MEKKSLKLGIIGLGQAASKIIAEIKAATDLPWVIAAAADPREHALQEFQAEFGGEVYRDAADLCKHANVDAVYIATPPWCHLENAISAAENGKHIICEKPMALSLEECDAMVAVAKKHGVKLLAGHTHSFDAPVQKMRELIEEGTVGKLHAINTWNFNEFNHRSRLTQELKATHGPLLNQGPHQVDVVRQIGGGMVKSVRASVIMDGVTGVEGGYVCYLQFEDGTPATLIYDGRALFDTAELFWWLGEGGQSRDPELTKKRRKNFLELAKMPDDQKEIRLAAEKEKGRYGAEGSSIDQSDENDPNRNQPFFGLTVVSCENATIRQSPKGLYIHGNNGREELLLGKELRGRLAELTELYDSIVNDRKPFHDGAWGTATLEVCFAIMESARTQKEITMTRQVSVNG